MARLTIATDETELAHTAAERMASLIEAAVSARGSAIVSLTGGTTPRLLYALLADPTRPWKDRIPWARVHLFWGDERHVPPDHPDSNFGMANDALVRHVPIPQQQVHRMRGELPDARDAARDYERTLTEGFAAAGRHDGTFDVMLLGLGEDAHIASIFPGSALLDTMHSGPEGRPLRPRAAARVAAVWAEHLGAWRITLTPLAILDSRDVLMIVSGGRKASAVHAALEGARDVRRTPAQLLRDAGDRVEWIIDRAASPYAAPPSPSARPG